MRFIFAALLTALVAGYAHAPPGSTVLRLDKSLPKGETVEIHSFYKGEKILKKSIRTEGQDSVILQSPGSPGLYFISLKGFGNYAEFIYNPDESLIIEANGELPNGMVTLVNSGENICYSDLMRINTVYDHFLDSLRTVKRGLPFTTPDYYGRSLYLDSLYDAVALEKNGRLTLLQFTYPQTYTSRYLVPFGLVPVAGGQEQRAYQSPDAYCSYFFFKYIRPAPSLLYHYALEDGIVKYLSTFAQPGEGGVKKSIDYVLKSFSSDTLVSEYVTSFLIKSFLDAKSPDLAVYVMGSSGEGCNIELGEKQAEYLANYKHVKVGNQVDDIVLNDISGQPVSLSNTCKKPEATVLLFWTSWCMHCKKMLPQLKQMLAAYKGRVQVFAVSLDEFKQEWTGFVTENDLAGWVHVSELKPIEKSSLAPRFMITHTPTIYLLDKERHILAANLDKDKLAAALTQFVH